MQAVADWENAGIAFKHSAEMITQGRALLRRVQVMESRKLLNYWKISSVLQAILPEAYAKHGMNASIFLADELHA